ncbi:hypothetical protein DR046_19395 [Jannaschia formosa]|nr:hypothetical protein DR046_19395 [Jannaschia formosa]
MGKAFREVLRLRNILASYSEFDPATLPLSEQDFEGFKSKYLDLETIRSKKVDDEEDSPLVDLDFELELLRRDEINVAYIVALIAALNVAVHAEGAESRKAKATAQRINDLLRDQMQLRLKRPLIEGFMRDRLPGLGREDDIATAFAIYWDEARAHAFAELCAQEGVDEERLDGVMRRMHFTGKPPLGQEIVDAMIKPPGILERKKVVARVLQAVGDFINLFDENIGDLAET